ncbi:testis-specific Y-encoded protein 1-like [Phodopus roborovskii]|uniref:testis-specific Y-encoded protein 1-like n=1 Tax=Phodopus roborovskii TaxID=109678 RepID=UPI0021E42BD9|nr:testis-specific Y-encoded protein 1-like [Phodopus roborovskii]
MASPKEDSEGVVLQELRDLVLMEKNLQGGEAPVQAPEQRPATPSGDNQSVKPLVGGSVETWVPLAESLQHSHTWEESIEPVIGESEGTDLVQVRNESKNENADEYKQKGGPDLGPELGQALEQACHSEDQHGTPRLPQSGQGLARCGSKMDELEHLQLELSYVKARYNGAFAKIKAKVAKMRRLYFERRKTIIQAIPGFWPKAMMNHPQMSSIITNQDQDLLRYMLTLEVVESHLGLRMCRMMFFFRDNPYFQNDIVTKDYDFSITGYKESDSSVIEWLGQTEYGYANFKLDTTRLTFFSWLCTRKLPGSSRIAEIIMDDLWPNPLYYYPKEDEP